MKICPVCDTNFPDQHHTCPTDGAVLIESHELAPGMIVHGKYRILRKLGQGGMGVVYLAEHLLLGGQVALKFLATELSQTPQSIKRFRNEGRATFQLRHANIVEVLDMDQAEDGSLYIAMEYVNGPSLRKAIDGAQGKMPVARALAIVRGVASGLDAAHRRGTVHRDIKPENILLSCAVGQDEMPKVLDFGIAAIMDGATRLSRTRGLLLTPEYASPEQWRGTPAGELDGRTDMYSLGCVFYEMLTGQTPFHAHNMEGWMYQHLKETPKLPSELRPELASWPGLDALVLRMMARERDQRPQGTEPFFAALARVATKSSEPPPPAPSPVWRDSKEQAEPSPILTGLQDEGNRAKWDAELKRKNNRNLLIAGIALGAILVVVVIVVISDSSAHSSAPTPPPQVKSLYEQAKDAQSSADYSRAVALFNQACDGGDAPSCVALAGMFGTGDGVTKDAFRWANYKGKACDAGDISQCFDAAYVYDTAKGNLHDSTQAAHLYEKGCNGGDAASCTNLGVDYENAIGVSQDELQAATLFKKACDGENALGCSNLGSLYWSGSGVSADRDKGKNFWQKGCNMGDKLGCDRLKEATQDVSNEQ
jgi:serine/threonine-protein kinase